MDVSLVFMGTVKKYFQKLEHLLFVVLSILWLSRLKNSGGKKAPRRGEAGPDALWLQALSHAEFRLFLVRAAM